MYNKRITINRKNETGAALMMALFFFTIASFIVTQLSIETLTESTLANRELKKLKSKYSAKAGLNMALLRIKAFQHAKASISKAVEGQNINFDQQLSMIWQFPLPWPITIPENAGLISKDETKTILKKSLISNITFFHQIQDAGQKIDLNSLGSPIKIISDKTLKTLLRTFTQLLQTDRDLSKEHSIDSIKEVLNNVADWIDKDEESRNGGSESSFYTFKEQQGYPRNSSFMTLSELMLVDKMDDLLFKHLKNLVTIHGTFGINVNTAEKNVLMSIDPQFTEQVTADFLKRRSQIQAYSGNLDENSFNNLLNELNFSRIEEIHSNGIPIVYSPLSTFLVTSSGITGNVTTTITAYVLDANALKEIFITQLDKNDSSNENSSTATSSNSNNSNQKDSPPPKGSPLIIHMSID